MFRNLDFAKKEMFREKHGKARAQEMSKLVSLEQIHQEIADIDRVRAEQEAAALRAQEAAASTEDASVEQGEAVAQAASTRIMSSPRFRRNLFQPN